MTISNEWPVLITDSTDGHRYDASYVWFRSHLCPSVESVVKKTPLHSFRGRAIPVLPRKEWNKDSEEKRFKMPKRKSAHHHGGQALVIERVECLG